MSSTSIQIRIQACTQTNTSLGCISKWLQSAPTLGSPCSWSQMKCQDPATFVQNYLWNTIDSTSICSTCLRCTEDPRAFFSIPTKKNSFQRCVSRNKQWMAPKILMFRNGTWSVLHLFFAVHRSVVPPQVPAAPPAILVASRHMRHGLPDVLPEKNNKCPLKMDHLKRKSHLPTINLQECVRFQGG